MKLPSRLRTRRRIVSILARVALFGVFLGAMLGPASLACAPVQPPAAMRAIDDGCPPADHSPPPCVIDCVALCAALAPAASIEIGPSPRFATLTFHPIATLGTGILPDPEYPPPRRA